MDYRRERPRVTATTDGDTKDWKGARTGSALEKEKCERTEGEAGRSTLQDPLADLVSHGGEGL